MVKEENTREIRKYFQRSESKIYQNLCDAENAILRKKYIAINIYIKNDLKKKKIISNQPTNFILLGTRRSTVTKPKGCRRKEIKITAEIKNRKPVEKNQ